MEASKHRPGLLPQRNQIDAARVRDGLDHAQPFLEPLDRRTPLSASNMMHPRADLQERAHERHFVAHGLEEQLLEQVARLEPVGVRKVAERFRESGVGFKWGKHQN